VRLARNELLLLLLLLLLTKLLTKLRQKKVVRSVALKMLPHRQQAKKDYNDA
jgi:hypothetical protein